MAARLALALTLLLSACNTSHPPSDAGPELADAGAPVAACPDDDVLEDNDSFAAAIDVPLIHQTRVLAACARPDGADADFLALPEPGLISPERLLNLTDVAPGEAVVVTRYDRDGMTVGEPWVVGEPISLRDVGRTTTAISVALADPVADGCRCASYSFSVW